MHEYSIRDMLEDRSLYPAAKKLRLLLRKFTGLKHFDHKACVEFLNLATYYGWKEDDRWFVETFLLAEGFSGQQISDYFNKFDQDRNATQYMGKLVGWRAFRYYNQTLNPVSFRVFEFSPFGLNIDNKPEPEVDNEYGFWAFKSKRNIIDYLAGYSVQDQAFIYCPVSLSGTVIEHELGYRASQMEILGMYATLNNSRRRGIAHKLGWPGTVYKLDDGPETFTNTIVEIPDAES